MVRLRLTAIGKEREPLEKTIDELFSNLKNKVSDFLVTDVDETLSQAIGNTLQASGKTVATAESCTGGYIAHLITSQPGASAYFKGSIVSYSNEAKLKLLQVQS